MCSNHSTSIRSQIYAKLESILRSAEEEFQEKYLVDILLNEIEKIEKTFSLDLSKLKSAIFEGELPSIESLKDFTNKNVANYLIKVIKLKRDRFLVKAILKYVKDLYERVSSIQDPSISSHLIQNLIEEYNTLLEILKRHLGLLPPSVKAHFIGKRVSDNFHVDWNNTHKFLKLNVKCLYDYLNTIADDDLPAP
ncbi:MAG TPA: hypothetical protein EYH04_00195 [Archaeoglobus profundus]|nr:hypothetical protein [Archaeoglobus profundus]